MYTKKIRSLAFVVVFLFPLLITSGCSFVTLPKQTVPEASRIYDANGKIITTLYKENRIQVPINKIPKVTQNAFVAVEDARFYKHMGVDPIRIIGAVFNDIKAGRLAEGGSTITQQTVKNLYLTRQKTFNRKLTEAWLSILLERKYTKEQILQMYLNQIYFGQRAYGIETAARTYFDKSASQLDLAESALLAGLPKAPNTYNPFQNWDGAKKRQKIVLNRMVETGFITQAQADKASEEKLVLKAGSTEGDISPYITNEIAKYITDKYEDGAQMLYSGGLSIYTGIDIDMQKAAEKAFHKGLSNKRKSLNGALVAIDPSTGQIKAMVGGRDYNISKFNRATQAKRQPGSAFKPFLYTAAIDNGKTEASTITCDPVEFPQDNGKIYKPTDYGNTPYHNRSFTLKKALAISDNIVAIKLNKEIGPSTLVNYAHKMGIKSKLKPYLSLALGTSEVSPLEITSAYCTLASGGIKTEPQLVLKVVDNKGNVLENNTSKKERAISPQTAYIVTDMMKAVLEPGGTANSLSSIIGRPAAGKTGTTQNFQDAWFVGFTPQLVTGVYIGYDDPKKSVGIPGGKIAGPIWANFMAKALENEPVLDFEAPERIVKAKICGDTGLLATPYSKETIEASFLAGTEPKEYCPIHKSPDTPDDLAGQSEENTSSPDENFPQLRRKIMDWFSGLAR